MRPQSILTLAFAAPFIALAIGLASAEPDPGGAGPDPSQWLSVPTLIDRLTAEGYHVIEFKRKASGYRVSALDPEGRVVTGRLDPTTGALVPDNATAGDDTDRQWLTVAEIAQQLADQGYTVLEVEREDKAYEVYVRDDAGQEFEGYLDPYTGAIQFWEAD